MAYFITPAAAAKIAATEVNDKDVHSAIEDLIHLINGNPHCGASAQMLQQLGQKDEVCRRIAKCLGRLGLPSTARAVMCTLPSKAMNKPPLAVLVHIPGIPPGVAAPAGVDPATLTTIVAVGGVLRSGAFF